jgi:O-antigen/teichoic acid export membrane protein
MNGLLLLILGSRYGADGAAVGFLVTAGFFIVPASYLILKRRRKEWQADTPLAS